MVGRTLYIRKASSRLYTGPSGIITRVVLRSSPVYFFFNPKTKRPKRKQARLVEHGYGCFTV
jgi:hypothetical protein